MTGRRSHRPPVCRRHRHPHRIAAAGAAMALAVAVTLVGVEGISAASDAPGPFVAYRPDSFLRTPLPDSAPLDDQSGGESPWSRRRAGVRIP